MSALTWLTCTVVEAVRRTYRWLRDANELAHPPDAIDMTSADRLERFCVDDVDWRSR